MSHDKAISAELMQAFLETEYIVHHEPPFTMKIGQVCPELLQLFSQTGQSCAAFITACNPYSQQLSDKENHKRQSALAAQLHEQGLQTIPGIGQHPSNHWPGEPSLLVLGLDLAAAHSLGRQHEQHALVWCGADGIPSLRFCDD